MRNAIKEYIEPSDKEKQELWEKAIFVFDTNVLLNLYRYSAKTRNSLLEAFQSFKDRVWIPYQVAYEYMRKRCEVIYETVHRYDQFQKEIDIFTDKASGILRLTSDDDEISSLQDYLIKWLDSNKAKNLLVLDTKKDEILDKVLEIFEGKVGAKLSDEEIEAIKKEGKERYAKSIPPGYMDEKKRKNQIDDNNAYGDLIIWKQIIKYAKERSVGIIYVTHDQKEDWWNIVKGETIGPRIELRREFTAETEQEFHMYSMNSFINTYNKMNKVKIDHRVIAEVVGLENAGKKRREWKSSMELSLLERIAQTEETLEEIQNRKLRREKVISNLANKYHRLGAEMSPNIQYQYDKTKEKLSKLNEDYAEKEQELEMLRRILYSRNLHRFHYLNNKRNTSNQD